MREGRKRRVSCIRACLFLYPLLTRPVPCASSLGLAVLGPSSPSSAAPPYAPIGNVQPPREWRSSKPPGRRRYAPRRRARPRNDSTDATTRSPAPRSKATRARDVADPSSARSPAATAAETAKRLVPRENGNHVGRRTVLPRPATAWIRGGSGRRGGITCVSTRWRGPAWWWGPGT